MKWTLNIIVIFNGVAELAPPMHKGLRDLGEKGSNCGISSIL